MIELAKYKIIAVNAYDINGIGIVDVDHWEYGEQYVLWVDMFKKDNKLHKSKVKYYPSGTPYFVAYGHNQKLDNYMRTHL